MMLKSVLFRRADATVINELALQNIFVASKTKVDSFDYRIMFTKKWQGFVDVFNRELALMKTNGELKKISISMHNKKREHMLPCPDLRSKHYRPSAFICFSTTLAGSGM